MAISCTISLFPKEKYVAKTTQKNIFTIVFLHSFLFIENEEKISEDYLPPTSTKFHKLMARKVKSLLKN